MVLLLLHRRRDGFNVQEWAKQRAERRREWAVSAVQKVMSIFRNRINIEIFFL